MKNLLLALLFATLGAPAWACRCDPPPSVPEATLRADAIFVGRVIKLTLAYRKIDESDSYREVIECEFLVTAALKGVEDPKKPVTIITNTNEAACGYPFRIGTEYLVYAQWRAKEMETNMCTRTRPRVIIDEKQDFSKISKVKADDALQTEAPQIRATVQKK